MAEETPQAQSDSGTSGPSTDIQVPSQYPTATKIDNGVAYDISGKALGPVKNETNALRSVLFLSQEDSRHHFPRFL